ncbi:MAG: hypothetical protein HKL96_03645 [Phycisphaerales bacterium]|nr:hypothetical protein [Phycisphaerales bacterium]
MTSKATARLPTCCVVHAGGVGRRLLAVQGQRNIPSFFKNICARGNVMRYAIIAAVGEYICAFVLRQQLELCAPSA